MHLELTVRRLELVQDWALHPHEHSQELAAVFGMLRLVGAVDPLLPDGRVAGGAHPWLKQMMEDLEILALLEDGRAIHDMLDGQPLLLFQDSDAHAAFIAMDIGQLRAWWLAQVQPASAVLFSCDIRYASSLATFVCLALLDDGTPCAAGFDSYRGLATQLRQTRGGHTWEHCKKSATVVPLILALTA